MKWSVKLWLNNFKNNLKLFNFFQKKPLTSKKINGRMDKSSGKTIWQAKLNKSEKNDLNQSIFIDK